MKALIVDDEPNIVSSISSIICWNFMDLFDIHTASSANEALKLAETINVDLLITDIRMEGLDGIFLAEQMRNRNPKVAIIFVSAYDQKEYLKAAIRFNAIGYIDKPIIPDNLVSVIEKFINGDTVARKQHENTMFEEKHEVVEQLLSTDLQSDKVKELFKKTYGFSITEYSFALLIIKVSQRADTSWLYASVIEELRHHKKDNIEYIFYKKSPSCYLMLCMIKAKNKKLAVENVKNIADVINGVVNEKASVTMAVSIGTENFQDIRSIYEGAVVALERGFYLSSEISYATAVPVTDEGDSYEIYKLIDDFSVTVKHGVKKDIIKFLKSSYNTIKQKRNLPSAMVKFLYKQFIYTTYVSFSNIDYTTYCEPFDEIEKVDFITFDELYKFAEDKILYSYDSINRDRLVILVKNYIESNYTNPEFSLKNICDKFHTSPSNLSSRFKNAMGVTVNNYITMCRLDKACALIKTGKYSVYEISFKVGYKDSDYFSRIFKKHIGITVTEYKKNAK